MAWPPTTHQDVQDEVTGLRRQRRTLPGQWVGSRNRTPHATTTTEVGTARQNGGYAFPVRTVRVVYANFGSTAQDAEPNGPVTFRAGFEPIAGGPVYPLTFGGRRTVTLDGYYIVSDPISVTAQAGQTWAARTFLQSGTPYVPDGSRFDWGDGFTATNDLTGNGAAAVTGEDNVWRWGPLGVLGIPALGTRSPVVALVGDSIGRGDADDRPALTGGFFVRALGDWAPGKTPTRPWVNASVAAMGLGEWPQGHRYRMALIEDASHLICQLGVNSVKGGFTIADLQGDAIRVWRDLVAHGGLVWQTALTPISSGTFDTVAGQTKHSNDASRVGFNDWLRAGSPVNSSLAPVAAGTAGALLAGQPGHPLSGFFETADAVESTRNSGVWKANFTFDGTHPNASGHAAMAAAIDVGRFT